MSNSTPRSEPLGSRQTDAKGKPITTGWNHDRNSTAVKRIDTTNVEQHAVGDRNRGSRA